jgi:hypothetical protein
MKATHKIVWPALIAAIVAYCFMATAAGVSYTHIVKTAESIGLQDWQRWITPVFIDGFALLGKVGRLPRFKEGTRRAGLLIMSVAGALSLVCNVYAGDTLGYQLWGILTVGCFIGAEWYATKLLDEIRDQDGDPESPATTTRPKSQKTDEQRLEQARRRAHYYEMDSAARAQWTRKWNEREARRKTRELGQLESELAILVDAPVSPAGPVASQTTRV